MLIFYMHSPGNRKIYFCCHSYLPFYNHVVWSETLQANDNKPAPAHGLPTGSAQEGGRQGGDAVHHQHKRALERLTFEPGARIFHEGDPAESAFLIESGCIELTKRVPGDEVVVATLGKGEILGEMALIDEAPRSATARAVTATVVKVVPRDAFSGYMEQTPLFIKKMLCVLSRRLRSQTHSTAQSRTVVR